ncbi:MAG: InlB B-repeat-containing protein [Dehalococcoidia bacterium]
MKKQKRLLLFLAPVLLSALLLSLIPALAGGSSARRGSLGEARKALEQELLPLAGAGFVGIAHSEAHSEVIVFVEDEETKQRVPHSFEGYAVRAEVVGRIQTLSAQVAEPVTDVSENRQGAVRPLVGGTSLSAYITKGPLVYLYAGTLGMVTYDGKILSNAHVIAMEPGTGNFLPMGAPIVQPGTHDGGGMSDRVGTLQAYAPIHFASGTENYAKNYADAAIASIDGGIEASSGEQLCETGNYWLEGWTEVSKGDIVRKSGRTSGVTTGEVIQTNVSVMVWYGERPAYFVDQIAVAQDNWSFAAPGDSGCAVDKDGRFVGLVFAGSEDCVVVCKAKHIVDELGISVEPEEGLYSLTISSTSGGSVAIPGEGLSVYESGTIVNLVAVPDEHYRFARWTGDVDYIADVYAPETTITMYKSCFVTANFELEVGWYSLNVSSTQGGLVTEPGEGTFVYGNGTPVALLAVPDADYHFLEWTGDVHTVADVYAPATYVFIYDSYSITANFQLEEGRHSLTISSTDGGSVVEPGEGTFICDSGAVVNLVAVPDEGYQFAKWSGDIGAIADIYAANTSITMNDSYSVTANFRSWHPEPMALLMVSSTDGGSVIEPGEGLFKCPLGIDVMLVAEATSGYRFVNWSGDVGTIADVNAAWTTITMDSSYSITANFEKTGSQCCAVTVAYGTPMAAEMQVLRRFRDQYLLTNPLGKGLVKLYYALSPPIARFLAEHDRLKPIARAGLSPAVVVTTLVVNTNVFQKAAIGGFLALVSFVPTIWATKTLGKRRGTGHPST